jgi:hypothetical protein
MYTTIPTNHHHLSLHTTQHPSLRRYNPANEKNGIDDTKINVHLVPRKSLARTSLRPINAQNGVGVQE